MVPSRRCFQALSIALELNVVESLSKQINRQKKRNSRWNTSSYVLPTDTPRPVHFFKL